MSHTNVYASELVVRSLIDALFGEALLRHVAVAGRGQRCIECALAMIGVNERCIAEFGTARTVSCH